MKQLCKCALVTLAALMIGYALLYSIGELAYTSGAAPRIPSAR